MASPRTMFKSSPKCIEPRFIFNIKIDDLLQEIIVYLPVPRHVENLIGITIARFFQRTAEFCDCLILGSNRHMLLRHTETMI